MDFLNRLMGLLLKGVYDFVSSVNPNEIEVFSNYAITIIITTIIFKILTLPFTIKQARSMAETRAMQPRIQELQKKYGNDQQTLMRKQQELYKESGYNPMSGCLPLLIQFPILIAMYNVFRQPEVYAFTDPVMYAAMDKAFFWIKNLNEIDTTLIMPIITAALSYVQTVVMTPKPAEGVNDPTASMNNSMKFTMPIMLFFIYRNLPAGLPFYWAINTVISIIIQVFINKKIAGEKEAA